MLDNGLNVINSILGDRLKLFGPLFYNKKAGRIVQWQNVRFTCERSVVRSHVRPHFFMSILVNLRKELKAKANPEKAKILQRFFKTGKGEYGEGDIFLGISVPETRIIAQKYKDLKFKEIEELLKSKIHEERLTALLILVHQFHGAYINGNKITKKEIFNFYLKNTKYINNWDLVDLSAPKIIGEYLFGLGLINETKQTLYRLAKSKNLWERRIAILATYAFIRKNKFGEILKISEMLLDDKHDLIHKAVGWMLREVGKRSQTTLEKFLKTHYRKMPRTMLRYAIERFSEEKRRGYLKEKGRNKVVVDSY